MDCRCRAPRKSARRQNHGWRHEYLAKADDKTRELEHLPYKKGTYEDYVGLRGLKRYGKKKWRRHVADVVKRLITALEPDEVVIGGGNVKKLCKLLPGCRAGDNVNAFVGGFRMWDARWSPKSSARAKRVATAKD